jgi:hypothetical protein
MTGCVMWCSGCYKISWTSSSAGFLGLTPISKDTGRCERSSERQGYRSGYYPGDLFTRVGGLALRVPRGRKGKFALELSRLGAVAI